MRVLIACEFSGIVREAFKAKGHDAWSCDLLPSEKPGNHYQGDIFEFLDTGFSSKWGGGFDLMIAHPPCTDLCSSGARWWKSKGVHSQDDAVLFFMKLAMADIPKIAIENPVGRMSKLWRKPNQIINPYEFGHGETKKTCLWLKGLPNLEPTSKVPGREPRIHFVSPSKERWKERSRSYDGIAKAMADQWGGSPACSECDGIIGESLPCGPTHAIEDQISVKSEARA